MKKRFFIKCDMQCKEKETEWIELSGREFYSFITRPENRERMFIDMGDIVLESPREIYKIHQREKSHSNYLKRQEKGITVVPLSSLNDESMYQYDNLLIDAHTNLEETVIHSLELHNLKDALLALNQSSYNLIHALYLSSKRKTEREIASEMGISQAALNSRKKKILKKLNLWLSNPEKVPNTRVEEE